jgi:hypothetical protein
VVDSDANACEGVWNLRRWFSETLPPAQNSATRQGLLGERIQYGQKPTKDALPEVANATLESVTVYPSEPKPRGYLNPADGEKPPTLQVATDRQVIHPVADRIEHSLSKKTADERGFLVTLQGRAVPVRVSVGSVSRAMRILDVLCTAFDESHYGFDWPKPYDKPLAIVIDQEKVRVTITEAGSDYTSAVVGT